ncbi:tetratricopeptide repeat protein [Desulfofustis glycolicus]|uniref:Uncharacterized protein n=1 Tax=Desulfofustis glycolicus DSM 9705 TaxID=1121409 RepID=A0A1M5YGX6_9BACT|nr:tetratricopeptide repeat protein [Desulfofustis glycolicus]MCB2217789.1 tetratricopeptide repeat protein [Desulfobulbaceae bacterium]SHI11310.1 hypothetical protein SAMN02745124_04023 [Desulfofustis glycolicus DSM 9705]
MRKKTFVALHVFVFLALLCVAQNATANDHFNDPKLNQALQDILEGFDFETATLDDCRDPYDRMMVAISEGVFEGSKYYLANAYGYQGMLRMCLSQNMTDEEFLQKIGPILESFKMAQKAAPDWAPPYSMLGNIYRALGNYTQSPTDFREAERFLKKALQLNPDKAEYREMLREIQQNLPADKGAGGQSSGSKSNEGFEPIPFE